MDVGNCQSDGASLGASNRRGNAMWSLRTLAAKAAAACLILLAHAACGFVQAAHAQQPTTPFVERKGRLAMPVQGRLVTAFGDTTLAGYQSQGIAILTSPGSRVIAPTAGQVVYAGEFRVYGRLVIINAGDGYSVLLGGLGPIGVEVGQVVSAGDPIGTMPTGEEAVLHLEIRKDNAAIDPAPWL